MRVTILLTLFLMYTYNDMMMGKIKCDKDNYKRDGEGNDEDGMNRT